MAREGRQSVFWRDAWAAALLRRMLVVGRGIRRLPLMRRCAEHAISYARNLERIKFARAPRKRVRRRTRTRS
jgi:hypothetical protein